MEFRRRPIPPVSIPEARLAAASGGKVAAVCGQGRIEFHDLDDPAGIPRRTIELGWKPATLLLSPHGRFVLAAEPWRRYSLIEVATGEILEERLGLVTAGFLNVGGREVLIRFRRRYVLEGIWLDELKHAFASECSPPHSFFFSDVLAGPFGDGDTFLMLGHEPSCRDSLVTLSFQVLTTDPKGAEKALRERRQIWDTGLRLAACACGPHEAAIFRDPAGAEDEEEAEGELPGVWGFRGLYVWDLRHNRVVERIDYDAPIESAAPMIGSESTIAIVVPGGVDFVERGIPDGSIWTLDAQVACVDNVRNQAVLIQPGGGVEVVGLP